MYHDPTYTTIHRPRTSFSSQQYSDSSAYSNIRGQEDFQRRVQQHKNINGRTSGFHMKQDKDNITYSVH